MFREFNKRKINIPFQQRDLRIISMPDVVCKVENDVPVASKAEVKAGT